MAAGCRVGTRATGGRQGSPRRARLGHFEKPEEHSRDPCRGPRQAAPRGSPSRPAPSLERRPQVVLAGQHERRPAANGPAGIGDSPGNGRFRAEARERAVERGFAIERIDRSWGNRRGRRPGLCEPCCGRCDGLHGNGRLLARVGGVHRVAEITRWGWPEARPVHAARRGAASGHLTARTGPRPDRRRETRACSPRKRGSPRV